MNQIDPNTYAGLELNDWPPFSYSQAGYDSQPEIQLAVQRFQTMPIELKEDIPLLWWLLNSSTQVFKMGQDDSDYREKTPVRGQTCDSCAFGFFRTDHKMICSQIRGFIKPKAWCRFWQGW